MSNVLIVLAIHIICIVMFFLIKKMKMVTRTTWKIYAFTNAITDGATKTARAASTSTKMGHTSGKLNALQNAKKDVQTARTVPARNMISFAVSSKSQIIVRSDVKDKSAMRIAISVLTMIWMDNITWRRNVISSVWKNVVIALIVIVSRRRLIVIGRVSLKRNRGK